MKLKKLFLLALLLLQVVLAVGCKGNKKIDLDKDGFSPDQGDCWDRLVDYPESQIAGQEIYPGAQETWYDGVDQDCSGGSDFDADDDGHDVGVIYGDWRDEGLAGDDCDDRNPRVYPGAREICDGLDNDCDGIIDEDGGSTTWYLDNDGDGFGASDERFDLIACQQPEGYTAKADDCDDGDPAINPGALEQCNGVDNDCNGSVDDGEVIGAPLWWFDQDFDGTGGNAYSRYACEKPWGWEETSNDCDDSNPLADFDREEVCDGIDNDCNGVVDDIDPGPDGLDVCE